ncbi:MAG TPA: MDR family MFS transporter [Ktedonobacteraceae bacterium]|nr:MDR family MFS transporter [Ktedonobacteraceae bacterium]
MQENSESKWPVYGRREVITTMIGLLLIMFLGTLDQTITATALPRIVGDLRNFGLATWITTIYLVIATVTIPIYGKLSDQFGRKPILFTGLGIFLVGSMLSGLAQTMMQLIVFRAFQALGDGALIPIASAVVGDLFLPRERAKWMGIATSAYGVATIVGPILGGWLTDHASWRWIFYVNVPVGLIILPILIFVMPALRRNKRNVTVDYMGALLLILGTVPLLLGFSWAGSQYSWLSPQVLGLFGCALLSLVVFLWYEARLEKRGQEPILEPSLFRKSARIFSVAMAMSLLLGMCTYGGAFYVPFFLQGVVGVSVTNSGLLLIPFALASVAGAAAAGILMGVLGKYKWQTILGVMIAIVGFLLLLQLNINSSSAQVTLGMVVVGLGLGTGMAIYTTVTQNALPDKKGQVSAAVTFFRQIGGSIGLAAMGSVMNATYLPAFLGAVPAQLQRAMPSSVLSIFENPSNLLEGPGVLAQIQAGFATRGPQGTAAFEQLLVATKTGLTQGVHNVFLICLVVMLVAFAVIWFLREQPLRSRKQEQATEQDANHANIGEVNPALS